VLRKAPGQPKRERKHHDTTGNMIAASSHVLFFYLSKVYPNGYMAVSYLLFLQEQIKDYHHSPDPGLLGPALGILFNRHGFYRCCSYKNE
jgi:hypothetical protein